jgi:hypothetical protein
MALTRGRKYIISQGSNPFSYGQQLKLWLLEGIEALVASLGGGGGSSGGSSGDSSGDSSGAGGTGGGSGCKLDDGDDDIDECPGEGSGMVGTALRKRFEGEWYAGLVSEYKRGEEAGEAALYLVEYEDGDREDLEYHEIQAVWRAMRRKQRQETGRKRSRSKAKSERESKSKSSTDTTKRGGGSINRTLHSLTMLGNDLGAEAAALLLPVLRQSHAAGGIAAASAPPASSYLPAPAAAVRWRQQQQQQQQQQEQQQQRQSYGSLCEFSRIPVQMLLQDRLVRFGMSGFGLDVGEVCIIADLIRSSTALVHVDLSNNSSMMREFVSNEDRYRASSPCSCG